VTFGRFSSRGASGARCLASAEAPERMRTETAIKKRTSRDFFISVLQSNSLVPSHQIPEKALPQKGTKRAREA
jgi:hypothetical protein